MKSRRKNRSEMFQVVLVHAAMLTAMVAIVMLINAFSSSAQADVHRAVASIANQGGK